VSLFRLFLWSVVMSHVESSDNHRPPTHEEVFREAEILRTRVAIIDQAKKFSDSSQRSDGLKPLDRIMEEADRFHDFVFRTGKYAEMAAVPCPGETKPHGEVVELHTLRRDGTKSSETVTLSS
jgi:hypothetical protein